MTDHPESGEEAFIVERLDCSVTLSIRAFGKPANMVVGVAAGSAV